MVNLSSSSSSSSKSSIKSRLTLILIFGLFAIAYFGYYTTYVHNYINYVNSTADDHIQIENAPVVFNLYNHYVHSVVEEEKVQTVNMIEFGRNEWLRFWKLSLALNLTNFTSSSSSFIQENNNFNNIYNNGDYHIMTQIILTQKNLAMENKLLNTSLSKNIFRIYIGDFKQWPEWALLPEWRQNKYIHDCPTIQEGQRCELLDHGHTDWSQVDLILTYSSRTNLSQRPTRIPWFKYLLEPPHVEQILTPADNETNMNSAIITYHRSSPIPRPYQTWIYYDPNQRTKVNNATDFTAGKSKMAAIVVSNCRAYNGRLEYITELQKYIKVDVYGKCGTSELLKSKCIKDKNCFESLGKEYLFYLAFGNSNCQDYITEKFFKNALRNNMLPIVMGAPPSDYRDYAPENSYIHIQDYKSPKELAEYMIYLSEHPKLYNSYFEWVGLGEFRSIDLFCTICSIGHANPNYFQQLDLKMIQWKPDTIYNGRRLCLERNKWYWD